MLTQSWEIVTFFLKDVGRYVKSTVTWGQEAKTQAKLAELGNATARPSRAVDPGDKADQPCVFFETARSDLALVSQ